MNTYSRGRRRLPSIADLEYGAAILAAFVLIVGLFAFNLYWEFGGPGRNAAVSLAKTDAGLEHISSVHYAVFSWCHSDLVGFHVTGERNGQTLTVTACVQPLGLFDYIRQPAL